MQEDVRYYSDSIRSYMVLSCGDMLKEAGYPVRMLESNDIPGILPVSVRTIEKETLLYFDITGKVSLANLYSGTLPRETALALLESLIRLQRSLSDYLLDIRSVLYSPEYVYCDLGREEFSFAYGPGEEDGKASPYAPLMDYLADHVDPGDRTMTELSYRLATLAARPEFVLKEEMISAMFPGFRDGAMPRRAGDAAASPAYRGGAASTARGGDRGLAETARGGENPAPGVFGNAADARTYGESAAARPYGDAADTRAYGGTTDARLYGDSPDAGARLYEDSPDAGGRMSKDALLREAFVQFGDPEPEGPLYADQRGDEYSGRVESDDRFKERPARGGKDAGRKPGRRKNASDAPGRTAAPSSAESPLRRRLWIAFLVCAASVICAGILFILYLILPMNAAQRYVTAGAMAVCLVAAVAAGAVGVKYAFTDPPEPETDAPMDVPASPEFLDGAGTSEPVRKGRVFAAAGASGTEGRPRAYTGDVPGTEDAEPYVSFRDYGAADRGKYAADRFPEDWLKEGPAQGDGPRREKERREPLKGKLYGTGPARGRRIDLAELPQTVGSLPGFASYVIKDDSVGQIHARIEGAPGEKLKITDLNSPTGTFINGERLRPNATEEVYPQDEIRFGRMEFCYRVV